MPGAGDFAFSQKFDFSSATSLPAGLATSTDTIGAGTAPYSQLYTTANVHVSGGSLQLKVPGRQHASPITGAEVYTITKDILYASVRTWVQVSNVAGTCHGNFVSRNLKGARLIFLQKATSFTRRTIRRQTLRSLQEILRLGYTTQIRVLQRLVEAPPLPTLYLLMPQRNFMSIA